MNTGESRTEPFVIREPRQLRALVSPVRQEIVDVLAAIGPLTVAQIAELLGRKPDALYYHVTALEKCGLLVETDRVRAGRRFCAVYDTPGRPLTIDYSARVAPALISRVIRAALRLAGRDFSAGFGNANARPAGPDRNLWGARVRGYLQPEDLPRANLLLTELHTLLRQRPATAQAQPHSFTFVFSPLATPSATTPPPKTTRRKK